jgi:hypothetical protein
MNIVFDCLPQIKPSLRAAAEMKIRNDIQESDNFKPCHTGPISVSILSSDPLEVSIKGSITCKCGKILASFNGSSDGATLNYVFAD